MVACCSSCLAVCQAEIFFSHCDISCSLEISALHITLLFISLFQLKGLVPIYRFHSLDLNGRCRRTNSLPVADNSRRLQVAGRYSISHQTSLHCPCTWESNLDTYVPNNHGKIHRPHHQWQGHCGFTYVDPASRLAQRHRPHPNATMSPRSEKWKRINLVTRAW
jgi:hypothetical protein